MIGLRPAEFDDLTPRQFAAYADGCIERRNDDQKLAQVNIYNLACLVKSAVWGKHMVKYERAFPDAKKLRDGAMSDEEMYASVCAFMKARGG